MSTGVSYKEADQIDGRWTHSTDAYDPVRAEVYDLGDREGVTDRPKLRRTLKRPFIIDLGENHEILDDWLGLNGDPVSRRTWYHGFGCAVFDGICINQTEFLAIDCAACIKSTFESFVKGCKHNKTYIDQHGTRRCAVCKDELGQDELDDFLECDDFPENDDPLEKGEADEYGDPDILLSCAEMTGYRSWNIDGKLDQTNPVNSSDHDQRFQGHVNFPGDSLCHNGHQPRWMLMGRLGTKEVRITSYLDDLQRGLW